ncbi:MAG: hypothetical protein PHG04_04535, partial [Candidatus Nanoarchaeia archaeon]|nr:hypothetical protein [Candidatus Nanoarchaeia archaeon]
YGRHSSCGTEVYVFSCIVSCNPRQESYNCRTEYSTTCTPYQECSQNPYDCSTYETRTGYYSGTCYRDNVVCDKATDYDNCLGWSEREIIVPCESMKLESYTVSTLNAKVNESLFAAFNLSNCEGAVNYELYLKDASFKGRGACGLNNLEFSAQSGGTQTLLLVVRDSKNTITKSLGTLLITNPAQFTQANNMFVPKGEEFTSKAETGFFDAKILELIGEGLSNEDILKNLMLSFGAVGLAITATQSKRIKDYIERKRDKKIFLNQGTYVPKTLAEYSLMSLPDPKNQTMNERRNTYENLRKAYLALTVYEESKKYEFQIPDGVKQAIIKNYNEYLKRLSALKAERDLPSNAWTGFHNMLKDQNTYIKIAAVVGVTAIASIIFVSAVAIGGIAVPIVSGTFTLLGGIGLISMFRSWDEKNRYASAMAAVYGIDAEEYKNAEALLLQEALTNTAMILTSYATANIVGSAFANTKFIKNKIHARIEKSLTDDRIKHILYEGNNKKGHYEDFGLTRETPFNEAKEIVIQKIAQAISDGKMIRYEHNGEIKVGFIDPDTNIFIALPNKGIGSAFIPKFRETGKHNPNYPKDQLPLMRGSEGIYFIDYEELDIEYENLFIDDGDYE